MKPINENSEMSRKPVSYRMAIIVSIFAHLALGAVLLSWHFPTRIERSTESKTAASPGSLAVAPPSSVPQPQPSTAASVLDETIEESVKTQVEKISQLPDDQKLDELKKNLKRMERVANPLSVQEVAVTIASTLGIDQQQYADKEPPSGGTFDTGSAQLQDVTRSKTESGVWKYESVMVDTEGRTMVVEMNELEGETAYSTFEQMKKYPMADGIYRGIVMPLMQKMLQVDFQRPTPVEGRAKNDPAVKPQPNMESPTRPPAE